MAASVPIGPPVRIAAAVDEQAINEMAALKTAITRVILIGIGVIDLSVIGRLDAVMRDGACSVVSCRSGRCGAGD
jgi:hypothetical protein